MTTSRIRVALAIVAAVVGLVSCDDAESTESSPPAHAKSSTTAEVTSAPRTVSRATSAPTTTPGSPPAPTTPGSVPVVVIDPGHNGANAQHPAEVNRLVDIGVGKKPCNTTGTQTNDGYPEHAFTWDVSQRVAARLRSGGISVLLTRPDDNGWGPCSVDRAAIANEAHAAATVSIHADGGPTTGRGFHVIEPARIAGLTDDIYATSRDLGRAVHDAVARGTSMPPSNYIGRGDGYMVRSDLGGLDRADVPAIFIECGNMRNSVDASMLESEAFRQQLADALATGILQFVHAGS